MSAKPIKIIQGATKKFNIRLKDGNGDAFNVAGTCVLSLKQTDGDFLEVTEAANANGSVLTPTDASGKLAVVLAGADTALLLECTNATMEVKVTQADTDVYKVQIPLSYSVLESLS